MKPIAVLYDNTYERVRFALDALGESCICLYYLGAPFDAASIVLAAEGANPLLIDDRVYEEIAPACPCRPWPLSLAVRALRERGEAPADVRPARWGTPAAWSRPSRPVLLAPSNDTHVRMLHPVSSRLRRARFMALSNRENAEAFLGRLGVHFATDEPVAGGRAARMEALSQFVLKAPGGWRIRAFLRWALKEAQTYDSGHLDRMLRRVKPSAVVLGQDWGFREKRLCSRAHEHGIPSVCLQEGPQDFEMPGLEQLQHADHVLLQSAVTVRYLPRRAFFVTGNPRLSDLPSPPLPETPVVMVNANFTYGIFEEWRDRWMDGVVQACRGLGLEFFLSRHPRDRGAYEGLPILDSNAFKIQDQIRKATVVVSRFSQVIYEAMIMGRRAVYYNPHGEVKRTLTDDRSGGLLFARTPSELADALAQAVAGVPGGEETRRHFLQWHCGAQDGKAADRCAAAIEAIASGRIVPMDGSGNPQ